MGDNNDFDAEDNYTNDFLSDNPPEPGEENGQEAPDDDSDDGDDAADNQEETEEVKELWTPNIREFKSVIERRAAGTPLAKENPILSYFGENYEIVNEVITRNESLLKAFRSGDLTMNDKDRLWMATFIAALSNADLNEAPNKALYRPESVWRDGIGNPAAEKHPLRPGRPQQKFDKNRRQSKEDTLAYLSYRSGQGGTYETFLPHSGIWVRLRRPALSEVVAMQTNLQAIRLKLGNETKGLAYSHASFKMINAITDLAVSCIVGSNRQYTTPSDLENEISIFDETILHHALAAVMYPDGFNYNVPCIADPDKCNAITEFKMNMSNIVFYDDAVFTKEQRKFIAKRFAPATEEDFANYRSSFSIGGPKVIWLDQVGIKLAPPSISERRIAANLWHDTLVQMTSGAFNEAPEESQRWAYISRLRDVTQATQLAHWVKAIYLLDPDAVDFEDQLFTDDPEILMEYVSSTLSEAEFYDQFRDAVLQYVNDGVIALVAKPSHQCEHCKSPQGEAFYKRMPHLVPIDMLSTFFTLAARKVYQ